MKKLLLALGLLTAAFTSSVSVTAPAQRAYDALRTVWPGDQYRVLLPCEINAAGVYGQHAFGNAVDDIGSQAHITTGIRFALAHADEYQLDVIMSNGWMWAREHGFVREPIPAPYGPHTGFVHYQFVPRLEGTPEGCP